jgi:hypothetical protein
MGQGAKLPAMVSYRGEFLRSKQQKKSAGDCLQQGRAVTSHSILSHEDQSYFSLWNTILQEIRKEKEGRRGSFSGCSWVVLSLAGLLRMGG